MRPCTPRPARCLAVALLVVTVLAALPGRGLAVGTAEGPGEIRRRIQTLDVAIGRVQAQIQHGAGASNRATWFLFKARRTLELAGLALREARLWSTAPDELRSMSTGPTPEERAVENARIRYRTLTSGRRVGGAVRRADAQRAQLTQLQLARTQQEALLAGVVRTTEPRHLGQDPTPFRWARAFLTEIGAPDCAENRVVLVAWQAQEGTTARFNPLATTHAMPGATDFNSVGVKNYLSAAQGLDATRETLVEGAASYGYEPILTSLRSCSDAEATAWYVNASAWCRECAAGAYLTAILPVVRADLRAYAGR